jgi:uncharacterized membrane protein
MALYFCNYYPAHTWVAIMWYEPSCEDKFGNYWTREGWFSLYPGVCKKVLPNTWAKDVDDDLSDINRYFCFYAQASDGAKWLGPYKRSVSNDAFERRDCVAYSQGWTAGFRLFDIDDNDDYTVNLVP